MPEVLLDDGATPHEEIVTVPEGTQDLADLSLVVGTGDLTVPADTVGEGHDGDHIPTDELDVPEGAVALLNLLREEGGDPWTTADAHTLAHQSDADETHVSERTIRKYLRALADEGVLDRDPGEHRTAAAEYWLK